MIGITLAAIALAVIEFLVFARLLVRERRAAAREQQAWAVERGTLVNQICHLSGKAWTPPPVRAPEIHSPPERETGPDEQLAVW